MFIVKANKEPIIGVCGGLHFHSHEIHRSKYRPKYNLTVYISKPSYYLLGFGPKIKNWGVKKQIGPITSTKRTTYKIDSPVLSVYFTTTYDYNPVGWYKKWTYHLEIFVTNEKLFGWLSK